MTEKGPSFYETPADDPRISYKRKIERILYSYPALLAAIENEKELEAVGMGKLFPAMVANYSGMPGSGNKSNPTEKYALIRAEKSMKIKQIGRGLDALTITEKELIKAKYFTPYQPSDKQVYEQLALGATLYYKIKEQALRKMAIALNII